MGGETLRATFLLLLFLCEGCSYGNTHENSCSAQFAAQRLDQETVPSSINSRSGPFGLIFDWDNPAVCSGEAVAWNYCFYIQDDEDFSVRVAQLGIYRRVRSSPETYGHVNGSLVTVEVTPGGVYDHGGYYCGTAALSGSLTVQEGDITGVCLSTATYPLNVAGFTQSNDYLYLTRQPSLCSVREQTESQDWSRSYNRAILLTSLEFAEGSTPQPQVPTPVSSSLATTSNTNSRVTHFPQPTETVFQPASTSNTNSRVTRFPQPTETVFQPASTSRVLLNVGAEVASSLSTNSTQPIFATHSPTQTFLELQQTTLSVHYTPLPNVSLEERESNSASGLSIGAIIGISTGLGAVCLITLLIIATIVCCTAYRKRGQSTKVGSENGARNLATMVVNHLYESEKKVQGENPYYKPASNEDDLYSQLREQNLKKIPRETLEVNLPLGKGNFGVVDRGIWHDSTGMIYKVAVKSLSRGSSREERIKFLQEAATMGQFEHPNVLKLYGVVVENSQIMLVLEIAQCGDLKKYLKSTITCLGTPLNPDVRKQLLGFSKDIAVGMHYLASKGFVHRDLAARNVLLTTGKTCKICDFGMSRDLEDETYYISRNPLVPLKWTAPEAVQYRKYSTASDVWSYGCVLYEIWSLGQDPHEEFTNSEVVEKLESGYRLQPPAGCPLMMHELMIKCWHQDAHSRPTFSNLAIVLLKSWKAVSGNDIEERDDGYTSITDVGCSGTLHDDSSTDPQSYYNTDHRYFKLHFS